MRLPGSWTAYIEGRDSNRKEGLYPVSPKCHCSPGTLIYTPVPVKPTFLTQNLLCPPHCCAAAHFSHLPANRHQTQWARSRFFYRKTTCSCLKERFNTEKLQKWEDFTEKQKSSSKKSKHYSHRREVMHKSEYPEEAILHCKAVRSQTPSLAFFLSPSFVGVPLSSLLQEQYSSFHFAGTPSGSKTSKSSLNSALLQWASLCYYIWVDTTYQDTYFLSKKLVLKIFKRFASVSKMKVY